MIRSALPLLALAAVALSGCDRGTSLLITPELEEETGFETGLAGWSIDRGPTSAGSGSITTGGASEGSSYVRIVLDQGTDVVWLERQFTLQPNADYSVTLSADLRTFEGSGDLRVFAGTSDPNGTGFGTEGPVPDDWTRTLAPRPFTTDAQGRVWVAIGVQGLGTPGQFGVDRLGAVFVRTSAR